MEVITPIMHLNGDRKCADTQVWSMVYGKERNQKIYEREAMSWRYKNLGESMLSAIWALSDIQRDTRQILREDPDADTRLLSTLLLEAEHLSAALETLFPPTLLERIWQEQKKENA